MWQGPQPTSTCRRHILQNFASLPLCQQLPALSALNVRYLIVPNDNYEVLQCVATAGRMFTPILHHSTYQTFQLY